MLTPLITRKPAFTVVGIETSFIHGLSPDSNAASVIGSLWDQLMNRVSQIPDRAGCDMVGPNQNGRTPMNCNPLPARR